MAKTTIGFGVVLILLGLGGYVLSSGVSIIALYPAFFGLQILILGVVAQRGYLQRFSLYGVLVLAVLGFLGSVRGSIKLFSLMVGRDVARPFAVLFQFFMAMICLVYIALWIKAFIDERRQATDTPPNA